MNLKLDTFMEKNIFIHHEKKRAAVPLSFNLLVSSIYFLVLLAATCILIIARSSEAW